MSNFFFCYFALTGLISVITGYYDVHYSSESTEIQDMIAGVTWKTGLPREIVEYCAYILLFSFGWILVPLDVINIFCGILRNE